MKLIKLLLIFISSVLPSVLFAQEPFKPNLKIHLYPLTLLEIDGGIRGGLEYRPSKYLSIKVDYNHLTDALNKSPNTRNFNGYSIRLEPRMYEVDENKDAYFSVQLQYKTKSWQLADADSIVLSQEIFSMNIGGGNKKYITKKLGIDYFGGLGFGPRWNKIAYGEGFFRKKAGRHLRLSAQLGASLFFKI